VKRPSITALFVFLSLCLLSHPSWPQDVDDNTSCLECHGEEDMTGDIRGEELSIFVDDEVFQASIHADMSCIGCHQDIEELPHDDELERVDCGQCHDDMLDRFSQTVHGIAAIEREDRLAATCASCHSTHSILPSTDPSSTTYITNIPAMCGRCHKEGTEMTATHDIHQHDVLSNYSMSIHGEGLFKQGLIVTAVCTSCHGVHDILSHQHPASKINKNNISQTCMQCHALIEQVHEKIIEGRLWEEEPHKVPICVECHSPHEIRKVIYNAEISDRTCLSCHSDPNHSMEKDGETVSLFVDGEKISHSAHADISCVKCHFDVDPKDTPVCKDIQPVDCSVCHAEQVVDHNQGIHGRLAAEGDENAPDCRFCHGTHGILPKTNQHSPTFSRNVPALCSRCHAEGKTVALLDTAEQKGIYKNYTMSIHGKGLIESGLTVTAMCTNCHTPHRQLPADDPESSVHTQNIGQTCGTCHLGIYEKFRESIHSTEVTKTDQPLPGCSDCHQSHTISRVAENDFRSQILAQCEACHEELTRTYSDTYHGKVSKLGDTVAAKCHDCHGSHSIHPSADPRSSLHHDRIIDTCKQCHPGSHRKFTGYLTHATHHDRDQYPVLYYSFLFMTALLAGTMAFFGLHTALWLIRSLLFRYKTGSKIHVRKIIQTGNGKYIRRFQTRHRITHLFVIVSFLSLALTGMTLKFPDVPFFDFVSTFLGGPAVLGMIHRIGAIVTFGYFGTHLFFVIRMLKRKEISLKGLFIEEYTMLPTLRDLREFKQNMFWFIGKADRPAFGRWTYWEKFDYFAVFWGVCIIGSTGLVLWFPEWATWILPGWAINVATVIHSDEALLAAAFIFTIHFFNTHFRPGIFPMDPVIFTGRVPLDEFIEERPREYQQMKESGELEKHLVDSPPEWTARLAVIIGFIFLSFGLVLVGGILYGMLFIYL